MYSKNEFRTLRNKMISKQYFNQPQDLNITLQYDELI